MTKRTEDLDIHQLLKLGRKKASETLPIFIVEDHNEALSAIYKAIRRRLLPMSNISMLHFDSHPDLSVPKYIRPELIFEDPEETLHLLRNSIYSKKLPMHYLTNSFNTTMTNCFINRCRWVSTT